MWGNGLRCITDVGEADFAEWVGFDCVFAVDIGRGAVAGIARYDAGADNRFARRVGHYARNIDLLLSHGTRGHGKQHQKQGQTTQDIYSYQPGIAAIFLVMPGFCII